MSRKADQLLTEWGIWTRQRTGVPRYVSPMLAIMRDNVPGSHGQDAQITEEDAEEVSALLARMSRDHSADVRGEWSRADVGQVLDLYYRESYTQQIIALQIGRPADHVRRMLDSGVWYVQAALDVVDALEAAFRVTREDSVAISRLD